VLFCERQKYFGFHISVADILDKFAGTFGGGSVGVVTYRVRVG
jgi:hypothetical protein